MTNAAVRGWPSPWPESANPIWGDLVGSMGKSLWPVFGGSASGDFSAPELYPCSEMLSGSPWINPYLRPAANTLTFGDAGLFAQRRTVESILNTPGGSHEKVTPWVAAIGALAAPQVSSERVTRVHMLNQLAMLRAKITPEILVWWDPSDPNNAVHWSELGGLLYEVYHPQLQSYTVPVGYHSTDLLPDRLRYTLRDPGQETLDCTSQSVGGTQTIILLATFTHVSDIGQLVLNLECAVSNPDVRAQIYVIDERGSALQDTEVNDFPNDNPLRYEMGFFTPINPTTDLYETRRTFPQLPMYLHAPDELLVQVVLHIPKELPQSTFSASFDLLQVVGDGTSTPIQNDGLAQGGDYDFSRTVEPDDALAFVTDYANGSALADFNHDGVIDINDVAAFLAAFNP